MNLTQKNLLTLFFDFYALNLLRDFSNRKDMIYFHSKQSRIDESAEIVTDRMFDEVYAALYYSCVREFRHVVSCSDIDFSPNERKAARKIISFVGARYSGNSYKDEIILWKKEALDENSVSIHNIHQILASDGWHEGYGGKLWGDGCAFLLKLPRTHSEKVIWIDRVLDLYHNNGPLLDKTTFSVLFEDFCDWVENFGEDFDFDGNALDFRANSSLCMLKAQCSRRVRNLLTANQRVLPDAFFPTKKKALKKLGSY